MGNREKTDLRRLGGLVAAVLATALVLPTNAAAQDPAGSGFADEEIAAPGTAELTVYGGALLPMSLLGAQGDSLEAELSTRVAFGATFDVWLGGGLGLGVGGGIASPDLTLTTVDSDTGTQEDTDLGSVDVLHGEAMLFWRPELRGSAASVLPYFGAGAGIRRLSFDDPGFEDTSDVTIVLGVGTHLQLSDRVHLRLDLRDLISSFEGGPFESSNTQHELLARVGVGIGL